MLYENFVICVAQKTPEDFEAALNSLTKKASSL